MNEIQEPKNETNCLKQHNSRVDKKKLSESNLKALLKS